MSNLSLLSRGNAQVVKTSQEKIEVYYEPEDYFNWRSYQDFHTQRILSPSYGSHKHWEVPTPKTYSTKKGALVLYSEDLALPWYGAQGKRFKRGHKYQRKKLKLQLSTLQDFTGAILTYGRKQTDNSDTHWKPYLHFINEETAPADKQIRPGYSPKRYLAHLFKTWDPNTLYKLQQAGSLRDSVQFQQLTTNMTETSRRHQDLSSVPLKYHCLPVFSSLPLPQWTLSDAFTNPGRCTPVQEESGNEEELGDEEKTGGPSKNLDLSVPCNGTVRKVSTEPKESVRSWKRQGELLESQQCEEIITSDRSEFSHMVDPFWKDSIPPTQSKPHATFYGGSFAGRRMYQPGKQDIMKHKNDKDVSIQEGGFLPPILQAHGSESNAVRNQNVKTQEPLRLPSILEETPRVAQPNRRLRASEPPKELLVIPLLVRFENQKSNADENSKPREAAMKEQRGQGVAIDQYVQPQLTDEAQVPSLERKIKTLQMDIHWNVDKQPDGDIIPIPEAQLVGSLPPINGKKGPGNQSSMANLKTPTVSNGSLTQGSKTLPTGIIRGSIPEKLKECCKGSSVGSLIMSPNGEIVCLSLVGAAHDTDIPVRFDFIPEQEEEDCLALLSTGQDEQCPGYQKTSEEANVGSNTSFNQPLEEESTTQVYRAKKHHPHVNRPNLQEDNAISRHQPPIGKIRRRAGEKNNGISMEINMKNGEDVKKERTSAGRNNFKSEEKIVYKGGECETGSRDLGQEPMKDVVVIPSGQRLSENDFQDIEAFQSIDEEEEDDEEEEESTPPKTMLRSTPSPDMNFESKAQDQAPVVKGPIATLPSRRKERIEQKHETKLDKLSTRTDTSKVTSQNKSEFKEQKLEKNGIGAEEIQDNETIAPSSVQAEQRSNQVELNTKGPNKQNITKEKTSGSPRKLPLQPISKSSEIMDKVSIDKEEKTSVITAQEVKRNIHNENQPMIEEEDMVLLQDIASSMKKETSWAKGKKKTKSEKTQKANKNPTTVSKTAKQAGVTQQGKAAFVVGQPKDKKAEGTVSPPKKTLRQVHRQDTSNVFQDIECGDKEEEEECMSIGSISMENEERNTTLAQSSDTIYSGSEDEVVPTLSSREADVPVDKPTARTLEVPLAVSQTSDDDTANSEISEATSGPLQKQKSSRARELSEKAERRRIEVEKKRKEREEQLKLEKEQQDRMEKMREELEQEQRRREEEARLKKQQQEQEKQRMEQDMVRKKQLEQQALERARQQQEEHRRKLQEMQRRKQQEELERIELERQRQREKEQMEAEERLRLLEMAAEEREEYKRKKQEKEEQAQREAEERRQRAEEEAKAVMEEARRQAQLLAKQTAELEQQLLFNQGLWQESVGMDQTQSISRPWVFSYYEFLQLLGLPLPVEAE